MRSNLLFVLAFVLAGSFLNAQSARYVPAMEKTLTELDSAKSTLDFQKAAATFERIGDAEKTQWLPYYYAALALIRPAWTDNSIDKDLNAEKAIKIIQKAEAIQKNAELMALRFMAATQQLLVNPEQRFMTYGMQMHGYMTEGLSLQPDNPRLLFLKGSSELNTPEEFGGGKKVAKATLEQAMAAFEKEKPLPLHPSWGRDLTADRLKASQQ